MSAIDSLCPPVIRAECAAKMDQISISVDALEAKLDRLLLIMEGPAGQADKGFVIRVDRVEEWVKQAKQDDLRRAALADERAKSRDAAIWYAALSGTASLLAVVGKSLWSAIK